MIHSITFRRWKSFFDTTLYLDQIMVLIGMNASGKSNVLDALSLLKALADGEELQEALGNLRGGAEWCVLQGYDSFELEVEIHQNEIDKSQEKYIYTIRINVKNNIYIEYESLELYEEKDKGLFLYRTEINNDDSNIFRLDILSENNSYDKIGVITSGESILSQVFKINDNKLVNSTIKYIIQIFRNIFVFDPIPNRMRSFSKISSLLIKDGSNISGVIASFDEEFRKGLQKQISDYITRLPEHDVGKVWVEKVGKFNSDAMLYCEETWPNGQKFIVDTRGMSDGTLRFLAIVTALLTRPEGSNLIIEEVDNGLHPSRAKLLLEMLREIAVKRQIDILVTTHNPALLDAMTPDYIGFITVAHRNPQGYSELTLLDEVDALPKLLASGGVGYLATTGKLDHAIENEQEQGE
ncbi:ATP-binding protein [Herpetosiphon gulosus]|uniref:ATPase AAA-type core domain-containing protein n=1 Tax=Herpetosiphon gulosus TaxID=1973496 RepID=A0ABP9X170_9CHLR